MPPSPHLLFETSRLVARHLLLEDVNDLYAVYGDADAMRYVGDGKPLDRAQCVRWVEITHQNDATRGYGMTALVERQTGKVVGFCGLVHPGGQPDAELKYALKRDHWGRGLATEAARALLHYGQQAFLLNRILATIAPANVASENVLRKIGMQPLELRANDDGTFTQVFFWLPPAMRAPSK